QKERQDSCLPRRSPIRFAKDRREPRPHCPLKPPSPDQLTEDTELSTKETDRSTYRMDPMKPAWDLKGTYFETCSCEVLCPCIFMSPPSRGDCSVLYAWHIEAGNYDKLNLDHLNVALAAYAPGHMQQVKWLAALYVDNRATPAQFAALQEIFTGKAGGHP